MIEIAFAAFASASGDATIHAYAFLLGVSTVRTTLAIDDELLAQARRLCGVQEKAALVREALKALIERESARRLARLGGSEPRVKSPPRRRSKPA